MNLLDQIREAGRLLRNVEDAAAQAGEHVPEMQVFCAEVVDLARSITTLLSETAMEVANSGSSRGGRSRAAALTPERRSEIARMGAEARWGRTKTSPLGHETMAQVVEEQRR